MGDALSNCRTCKHSGPEHDRCDILLYVEGWSDEVLTWWRTASDVEEDGSTTMRDDADGCPCWEPAEVDHG